MLTSDVDGILHAQTLAYPDFLLESAEFFLNRLQLAPDHCWVACASDSSTLLGYLVSYPWNAGLPPALGVALTALPSPAEHWFVHDCAVVPRAQGHGVAKSLMQTGAARAVQSGLRRASLVSLQSAVGYWLRHGYRPVSAMDGMDGMDGMADLAAKLADYGPDARYMTRGFPL